MSNPAHASGQSQSEMEYQLVVRRDRKFYLTHGDVVLLVENTLFKIHRYVLSQDDSAFKDMFDFEDQTSAETSPSFVQDGTDDEHPILVPGDEANKFRDLLWALYSLPQELYKACYSRMESEIVRLCNVAGLSHKYHFSSTECWAVSALLKAFEHCDGPDIRTVSIDTLTRVTQASLQCSDFEDSKTLLELLEDGWLALFLRRDKLGLAITILDDMGNENLCAQAYMAMLMEGKQAWREDPHLTQVHHRRLLNAYYHVSELADSLSESAPQIIHPPDCIKTPSECDTAWAKFWRHISGLATDTGDYLFVQHHRMDVVGRLGAAHDITQQLAYGTPSVPPDPPVSREFLECQSCFKAAYAATKALLLQTREKLWELCHDDHI